MTAKFKIDHVMHLRNILRSYREKLAKQTKATVLSFDIRPSLIISSSSAICKKMAQACLSKFTRVLKRWVSIIILRIYDLSN